ncbi:hypothetical protein F8M41_003017 [Gigaspora margarita]|uniref:Uncharacterized protein n=1 Tax=Gigaspora margarita TaxID=4874 RepID=A0A8H3XBW0_GIGMA|nr:hypothetical protein F8M41_003017 [Gigaspora margarita]
MFWYKRNFQANPYIEYTNGTKQQCLDYCDKDFDHCKNPLYNPNPKKDPNIAGPFFFIYDKSKFKNQKKDTDNNDDAYLEAVNNILNRKDINETIVKFMPKCKKWAYTLQCL